MRRLLLPLFCGALAVTVVFAQKRSPEVRPFVEAEASSTFRAEAAPAPTPAGVPRSPPARPAKRSLQNFVLINHLESTCCTYAVRIRYGWYRPPTARARRTPTPFLHFIGRYKTTRCSLRRDRHFPLQENDTVVTLAAFALC